MEIDDSTIPNAGKGLFVNDPYAGDDDIIFRPRAIICNYDGEIIDQQTLLDRYGQYTAPYGIEPRENAVELEDAALVRSAGSHINHRPTRQTNVRFSVGRNNRMRIVATKNIRNHRELFVNYGSEYMFDEDVETSTNNRKWTV